MFSGPGPAPPPPPGCQTPIVVQSPPCPYVGEIPGGLQNGTTIVIEGQTPMHQNCFSVNLSVSPVLDPMPDTALHVNPRFNENSLILNSLIRNEWGSEVKSRDLPLKKGRPFEMIILVASNEYKIALNGRHFMCYAHRMPKESSRYLVIKGGIQMNYIKISGSYVPPPQPSGGQYPVIYNPSIPITTEIPGGIYPQRMIQISGFPKAFNPQRFTVNLKAGCGVALHFDVRFSFGESHNSVVRNSTDCNGDWGDEETDQVFFPFQPGVSFDILILIESHCYMVAVNSQHFCAFNHRMLPLSQINLLEITGDVQINMIKF